jgi:predicted secreted Zn-dependent protease
MPPPVSFLARSARGLHLFVGASRLPWRSLAGALAFTFAAVPGAAMAQVFQCNDNGRKIFTDVPCPQGLPSTPMTLKNMPSKSAGLDTKIIWNRYPVTGRDYASLVRSLSANGPKGFHGVANWDISYQYTTVPSGNMCRFDSVRLSVKGEILMPKWTDEDSAPPTLRQRWQEYYAALQQHEEGHVQLGNELAVLVQEKFLGYGDMACGQAKAIAQSEFDRLYNNMKNRDKEYDQRTQHGATQGARFLP